MYNDLSRLEAEYIFDYDPKTGHLYWKISTTNSVKIGQKAGSVTAQSDFQKGYIKVSYKKKHFYAHRIIYIMLHGSIPDGMQIDHINGNKLDNTPQNLRVVSVSDQHKNYPLRRTSKTGVTGVTILTRNKKLFRAHITVNKKFIHLGCYDNISEAIKVRREAEKKYGFHPNHGRPQRF